MWNAIFLMIIGTEKLVTSSDGVRRLNKTFTVLLLLFNLFSSQAIFSDSVLLPFVKRAHRFCFWLVSHLVGRWDGWAEPGVTSQLFSPELHELNYYCTEGAAKVKPLCYKLAVCLPLSFINSWTPKHISDNQYSVSFTSHTITNQMELLTFSHAKQ